MNRSPARWGAAVAAVAGLLLAGCAGMAPVAPAKPLACDDSIKSAYKPDALTSVVAVRLVRAGEMVTAVDSNVPVRIAGDTCLVKLLVGPGATAEKDRNAKSWSEGIGMEVWLPVHARWNERIRNYGGGGWVGGGHRFADRIGSKMPALAIANMGYATSTHDGGQPHYQDPSFLFLSDGRLNAEGLRDMSSRAMLEQAVKTRALVQAFYGKAPRYSYYDGHSTGGRQGLKVAQEWPQHYDGYLIAQPAVNAGIFSLAAIYPQVVMKTELGFDATDKPAAAAFARKVDAANARAVRACDREGLGFLLDPFACGYSPSRDAAALCTGAAGQGVTGTNADTATCLSAREAGAIDRIWNGPTADGGVNLAATPDMRSGKVMEPGRLYWTFTRGSAFANQVTKASTDVLAIAMRDVAWAASPDVASGLPLLNPSQARRDRWRELDYAGLARVYDRVKADPLLQDYATGKTDLRPVRDQGRKVLMWAGLAEDSIPPATAVQYYESVAALAGGVPETQKFFRLYLVPGMAHSSQGRAYTVGGQNNSVPMPWLPANANQNPTPDKDTLFTALVEWVERGQAPGDQVFTSRDNTTSLPVCVYPRKAVWNGVGNARQAASYSCR